MQIGVVLITGGGGHGLIRRRWVASRLALPPAAAAAAGLDVSGGAIGGGWKHSSALVRVASGQRLPAVHSKHS